MSGDKKSENRFLKFLWVVFCAVIFGIISAVIFLGIVFLANRFVLPSMGYSVYASSNNGGDRDTPDIDTYEPTEIEKDDAKEGNSQASLGGNDVFSQDNVSLDEIDNFVVDQNKMTVVEVAKKCMSSIVAINITMDYTYYGITTEASSAGSGILVGQNDDELLIATNYHVVENNKTLYVCFCDGTTAEGEVKGKKVSMDLAVVAVKLDDVSEDTKNAITIAQIGDSDSLVVGEEVVAIGNAMGYGQSVTYGVVSALNREMTVSTGETGRFIQTDAAINPGNSGGALFNMYGQLIGINSNKLGGSSVEGMGYAIPINEADPIIDKLMNLEELEVLPEDEQSVMGISGTSIKEVTVVNGGIYVPRGIYIQEIFPGGTAEAAGLRRGDVITEFNGDSVISMAELKKYLAAVPKGTEATITYRRYDGSTYAEYDVTVVMKGKTE